MTKPTIPNSPSRTETSKVQQPRPWLKLHYEAKRQRTIHLVKAAIDQLIREQQTVTIEAICRKSVEVDAEGRGVKKSAILENEDAHAYYRKHSTTYQTAKNRNRKVRQETRTRASAQPLRIDPNRDVDRVRYRYLQLTKAELVDRLLDVEQAYAEIHLQLAHLQFQLVEQEHQIAEQQQQGRRNHRQKEGEKNNNGITRTTE
jgi:hypothetical protein